MNGSDERIVSYMKERDSQARTVSCAAAVQLFALAVYFCLYALISGGVFYSLSEETGKTAVLCICAVIAAGLCVLNIMCVIRGKKVYITRPDAIAMREGEEVVKLAYDTARPVLIYKITYSLVIAAAGILVNIILQILLRDHSLAAIYGKIAVFMTSATAILIAYPCLDRIRCYLALLGQTHELHYDVKPDNAFRYVFAVAVPSVIFIWYVLRYYHSSEQPAWEVFPFTILFGLAVPFLINWAKACKNFDEK